MKRVISVSVVLVLVLGLILTQALPASASGYQGCTPGFWKNHTNVWVGFSPDDTLEEVFNVPDSLGLDNDTLLEALQYPGGPGVLGGAKILFRAAVAGLLNAAHPDIYYVTEDPAIGVPELINEVNGVLASLNRGVMLTEASYLDGLNNQGCPIDAHGNLIDGNFD